MAWMEERENGLVLNLRVVPRASRDGIEGLLGDALKVRIQAPPVEGKANAYLVRFLSREWKIPRRDIEILSGETGRNKRVLIANPPGRLKEALLKLG